ncbi:small subunit of acetolactate synthase-domain-containing protein, partial [Thamnocephalis sphaerospora]
SASSTSAITFKLHRHRRHLPPLPTAPQPTAEEAVTNILYNTPDSSTQPSQRRVLSCLVQDEPGVLSRVSGILAGRGFNIESLVVSKTEVRDLSRMTIIVKGQEAVVEQARRQLEDLVPVWAVIDYTGARLVERELLLVKVSTLGPEQELERQRQLQRAAAGDLTAQEAEASHRENQASTKLPPPSVMLRETQDNLRALSELANLFRGRVVDVSAGSVVLELCAKSNRIEAFVKLIQPFGILEAARSGVMAMPRAYMPGQEDADANAPTASEPTVDATMLPPG